MEWIVHYGMAKTGTTTLQGALAAARKRLLGSGILYPEAGSPAAPHHILTPLFKAPEHLPEGLRHRFGHDPARIRTAAEKVWLDITRQIERHRPEAVVLSSEMFLSRAAIEEQERFRDLLSTVSASIRPCIYVRSPAPLYLSGLYQDAKKSARIDPPHPLRVRPDVEAVESAFAARMNVRAFERDQLRDGDIVRDFLQEVVGDPALAAEVRAVRRNETASAEAMSILQRNRRTNHRGTGRIDLPAQVLLREALVAIEAAAGRSGRPELRPGIAEAIVRASTDLLWLRDRYGVTFRDVDYSAIDGSPIDHPEELQEIESVCVVDATWRDELLYLALGHMLDAGVSLKQLNTLVPAEGLVRMQPRVERLLRRIGRALRR